MMNENIAFTKLCKNVSKNHDKNTKFNELADYLFDFCYLYDNKKQKFYYFTEIEFYYWSPSCKDAAIYAQPEKLNPTKSIENARKQQGSFGHFYLHGSGMDFTFGNSSTHTYAGILIRGIKWKKQNFNEWNYIDGPYNVRKALDNGENIVLKTGTNDQREFYVEKHSFQGIRKDISDTAGEWKWIPWRYVKDFLPKHRFAYKRDVLYVSLKLNRINQEFKQKEWQKLVLPIKNNDKALDSLEKDWKNLKILRQKFR